ncbi:glutathione S-transferase domain-containing protein [Spizellomyces punctatus DAOM BR117]|uniref:Glutathione S-transferase domain-containing protein n=1 Tax=Spizellomyces punctatus (strain DAOM BR117) TaxID=645134 RepID=A0A0L0HCV4_SPIPD|nr:glutathione S-transferase domain-containing protein [Spizellomyces punctatus DAOM BR117]KNC98754.1 glutathione S-transferase domain-containing protein [Spizellomyces punctatus DAOM BR117]|eukprot:XP_016606794.1 glutathione S-transferase domain-containing protein [Spizellomyces punctatus DAOM BR117]
MSNKIFKLHLLNLNYSSWSLRARIAVEHCNIPCEIITYYKEDPQSYATYKALSPTGLLPLLEINSESGSLLIGESLAILETFAESTPSMWPTDPLDRAHARFVAAEMHGGFLALRKAMSMDWGRRIAPGKITWSPDVQSEIQRIFDVWRACRDRTVSGAGAGADEGYLYGSFTIADAMYVPVVLRFQTYGVEPRDAVIADYMQTVLNTPAMRKLAALAEEERKSHVFPWPEYNLYSDV